MMPTKETAVKILDVLKHGLSHGVGKPKPGKMCVEAAVCYAMGLPHGDNPPCVGPAVRLFKIALNDCSWSSEMARAKGLRRVAIAQLGSESIDQTLFVTELVLATVRKILPIALRGAEKINRSDEHKSALVRHAEKCESVNSFEECYAASDAASYAASAASYAASDAASYAASAASYAASAASAASYAAIGASYAASAASYAASAASDASDASYDASYAASDEVLAIMAECGVEALQKCNSPGCRWLYLCEMEAA